MFLVASFIISSISLVLPSASTTTTTAVNQTCTDRIGNCVSYGSKICSGTYQTWAEINCKDFCGLCVGTVLVPTAGPLAPSPGTCADEIRNCTLYDKTICSGAYHVWAKQHCADFCGFCTSQQVTQQVINTHCTDLLPNCNAYGKSVCRDPYTSWSKENCAGTCGFCGGQQPVTKPTPCMNKISNCPDHTKYACVGVYVTWAKQHCALYCGLCSVSSNLIG